jgi:hypothetical protein
MIIRLHLGQVTDKIYFTQALENIAAWLDNKPWRSLW